MSSIERAIVEHIESLNIEVTATLKEYEEVAKKAEEKAAYTQLIADSITDPKTRTGSGDITALRKHNAKLGEYIKRLKALEVHVKKLEKEFKELEEALK